jgi:hypothetical protein
MTRDRFLELPHAHPERAPNPRQLFAAEEHQRDEKDQNDVRRLCEASHVRDGRRCALPSRGFRSSPGNVRVTTTTYQSTAARLAARRRSEKSVRGRASERAGQTPLTNRITRVDDRSWPLVSKCLPARFVVGGALLVRSPAPSHPSVPRQRKTRRHVWFNVCSRQGQAPSVESSRPGGNHRPSQAALIGRVN